VSLRRAAVPGPERASSSESSEEDHARDRHCPRRQPVPRPRSLRAAAVDRSCEGAGRDARGDPRAHRRAGGAGARGDGDGRDPARRAARQGGRGARGRARREGAADRLGAVPQAPAHGLRRAGRAAAQRGHRGPDRAAHELHAELLSRRVGARRAGPGAARADAEDDDLRRWRSDRGRLVDGDRAPREPVDQPPADVGLRPRRARARAAPGELVDLVHDRAVPDVAHDDADGLLDRPRGARPRRPCRRADRPALRPYPAEQRPLDRGRPHVRCRRRACLGGDARGLLPRAGPGRRRAAVSRRRAPRRGRRAPGLSPRRQLHHPRHRRRRAHARRLRPGNVT
jgi:hypothetical protein